MGDIRNISLLKIRSSLIECKKARASNFCKFGVVQRTENKTASA